MKLKGRLIQYTEQGMEGGYLSFQDENQIRRIRVDSAFGFSESRKVWNSEFGGKVGKTSNIEVFINDTWTNYYDQIIYDEDYEKSSIYLGELKGDKEADKRLSKKYNFQIMYLEERLNEKYGVGKWRYDGSFSNISLDDGTKVQFGDTPDTKPNRPYGITSDTKVRMTVYWSDGTVEHIKLSTDLFIERWDYNGLYTLKPEDLIIVFDKTLKNEIDKGRVSEIGLKIFSDTKLGHFEMGNMKWEKYFEEFYEAELHRENINSN
jgi:hypothetical protein